MSEHEHHTHGLSCGCEHCGSGSYTPEDEAASKRAIRVKAIRLAVAVAFLIPAYITSELGLSIWIYLPMFIAAWLTAGADVLIGAVRGLFHGNVFGENLLMTIATIGALAVGEYPEAAGVMIFYQLGEMLSDIAVGRSRKAIAALTAIAPDRVKLLRDGAYTDADPKSIVCGDVFTVSAGERIPADGCVTDGSAVVDASPLTGEVRSHSVSAGSAVTGGYLVTEGTLTVRAAADYAESTVAHILELAQSAADKKTRAEKFITRFSRIYTPVVVGAAVILAFVPPIFAGDLSGWVMRALTFLVISCPCALVISVPLAFFGGIGAASKRGILVKGTTYLERISKSDAAILGTAIPEGAADTLTGCGMSVTQAYGTADERVAAAEAAMNAGKRPAVYVGGSIGDIPALSRADAGIAAGAELSAAVVDAADIVIISDDAARLSLARRISKKVMAIAWENIVFAIAVKLAVLILAAFGIASMWLAVFADVGVTFIAILNSLRAMRAPR